MKPKEAIIAVTYRCNARCTMCNIWQCTAREEMEAFHYRKLPETLRTINITGGEPFLRKDLVEVIRAIDAKVPKARIVFSTNGLKSDEILSTIGKVREFHKSVGVGVSIDGMEETHDRIRGVQGAFKNAVTTVEKLKESGMTDLRIGMTLIDQNIGEAGRVYELSRTLGVEFTVTFAHNSEIYFQKTDNKPPELVSTNSRALEDVLKSQLSSRFVKDWFRAYHVQGIMDPDLRHEFVMKCKAGCRYFFMSPSGDVYPCQVMNLRIGNLREVKDWRSLFTAETESRVLRAVRSCREDCWMVCNTRSHIIAHPLRACSWVLVNKLRVHSVPKRVSI